MAHVELTCETCGTRFTVRPYRAKTARFCSKSCCSSWIAKTFIAKIPKPWAAKNGFQPGHNHGAEHRFAVGSEPWNKGVRGLHLSPATEFKPGQKPHNACVVGDVCVRRDRGTGAPRVYVKTAEPNVWKARAVLVWEQQNGAVAAGMVVHHEDRDTLNDTIENLVLLSRAQHLAEHRAELRGAANAGQVGLFGAESGNKSTEGAR